MTSDGLIPEERRELFDLIMKVDLITMQMAREHATAKMTGNYGNYETMHDEWVAINERLGELSRKGVDP